ncbi:MAG TPA: protein kinase [Blastocatellia bacterium]|nr:protein kinase [Blastocatellia bacterium]
MRGQMRFCPFDGAAVIDEDPFIGALVGGRYRLEERIGGSATASEYRATDTRLARVVAVKLFGLDPAFDQDAFSRLSMKLSATSSFYHPNVITIFDFGVVEESPTAYIVLEFIEGVSLKERIDRAPLSYDDTLVVVEQVCSALESLHAKGIVHGNLNSEDIRLYGDNIKQLELQLVDIDSLGELKGNPEGATGYMSPERVQRASLDARADVYSLGMIVYEALMGRLPFKTTSPADSVGKRPDLLKPVEAVVMRAISIKREDRQASAAEFYKELQEAITRKPVEVRNEPTVGLAGKERDNPIYLDDNVQFTVYRPSRVRPREWYTMLAFAHLSERPPDAPPGFDPVEEVRKQAARILGDASKDYRTVGGDSRLAVPRQGELTMAPRMPGVEFNPPFATFVWEEPVHRQEFRLRASAEMNGQTVWGRLSVYLGSILLAEVGLSIRVDVNYDPQSKTPPQDVAQARAFRKIFASYSHKDISIVEQFERIALASGDDFIRDWTHLRAGEVWGDRLMQMIKEASIFQLFWSSNSMKSPFVRREWEYALSLNRANFIRPVYWEEPFPESREQELPPDALRRLQFHRLIEGVGSHPQLSPDEADTTPIKQTTSAAPPTRPTTEQRACANCGKSKPATTRFCPYCGAQASPAVTSTSRPQLARPNNPTVDAPAFEPPPAMEAPSAPPTYSPPTYSPPPPYGQQGYGQQPYPQPHQQEPYQQGYQQSYPGAAPYTPPPQAGERAGISKTIAIVIGLLILVVLIILFARLLL